MQYLQLLACFGGRGYWRETRFIIMAMAICERWGRGGGPGDVELQGGCSTVELRPARASNPSVHVLSCLLSW